MSYQADVAPLPELATKSRAWQAPEGSIGKSRERLAWLLVLPSLLGESRFRLFSVVAEAPDGTRAEARLSSTAYRQVVAATNSISPYPACSTATLAAATHTLVAIATVLLM